MRTLLFGVGRYNFNESSIVFAVEISGVVFLHIISMNLVVLLIK